MPRKTEVRRAANEQIKSIPRRRDDGEMYARPRPNPFTKDWCDGYDAGLAGKSGHLGMRNPLDYWDGHKCGLQEKRDLDELGSSNA